ncbi:THO complex subunit 3 [Malus domestica]|uniref:THO complex subunit 3 n=1 Tax=Malus domestica TaxID=3750 RepID=UPI003974D27D
MSVRHLRGCLVSPLRLFTLETAIGADEEPTIHFKNLSSREYQGHKKKVHSVAWNCTGTKLASGSVDQTARVLHIEPHGHGEAKDIELKGHTDSVDQLCWDPKHADLIATASGDKTVRLWEFDCHCSKWKMCTASRT